MPVPGLAVASFTVVDELSRGGLPPPRATAGAPPSRRTRVLAASALVLLGLVAATLLAAVLLSRGLLVLGVAVVQLAVVVAAACGWWALTTRRRWKRRLNLLLAGVAGVVAVLAVAVFSGTFAGDVALLLVLTGGYAEVARRALAAVAAPGVPGLSAPPVRPWLLVNPRSGGGKATRLGLAQAAAGRGIDVHVLAAGEDARELALAAVAGGADAVGVAGGDGSLRVVAEVAATAGLPFLCVPAGTRNHFAADLGLDRARPLAALDALAGRERRVDLGTVGGRVFLNNVSLGAYADLVGESAYREDKLGTARALLPGMLRAEQAPLALDFQLPDGQACADAVLVLVGNNPYRPSPLQGGARPSLDTGLLQVSVLRARTGAQIAATLSRVATGRAGDPTTWVQWTTAGFRLGSGPAEVRAAVDGEAVVLAAPLDFGVRPVALRVLVPAGRRRRLADLLAPLRWRTARTLWTVARGAAPR